MPRKYPDDEKTSQKLSRSTKLRKYASVYKSYIRKTEQSKVSKSPRRHRKRRENSNKISRSTLYTKESKPKTDNNSSKSIQKSKRKSLNAYQKFVQIENKKIKYKDLPGKKRLSVIAEEWRRMNK